MISAYLTRVLPPPYRNKPISDPQRSRLYMLERELMGVSVYHCVRKSNLEIVMRHVCRYYKIKAPKLIVYNDPSEHSFGYSEATTDENGLRSNFRIGLNRGFHGANLINLLHELAHYIADSTWAGHHGHGPNFVGVYMHLLDKYRIIPRDAFRVIAKRRNITIARRFKPGAIRG